VPGRHSPVHQTQAVGPYHRGCGLRHRTQPPVVPRPVGDPVDGDPAQPATPTGSAENSVSAPEAAAVCPPGVPPAWAGRTR